MAALVALQRVPPVGVSAGVGHAGVAHAGVARPAVGDARLASGEQRLREQDTGERRSKVA